ncbi:MAG: hypothetical protein H0W02_07885 [Ktedonobacteraceae bacterium]|nr:hypothetical protein [Ktedonobacteraceae bacterium]
MRGKLRDKRADTKRDSFKRELEARRRPVRRDNRNLTWLSEQLREKEDEKFDDEGDLLVEQAQK